MKIIKTAFILITLVFSTAFSNDYQQDSLQTENNTIQDDLYSDDKIFNNDALYQIVMNNGNKFVGKILSQDEKEIELLTDNIGEVTLSKEFIQSIKKIDAKDALYQIIMNNDNKYIGKILSQDENEIELLTDNMGKVTLSKEFIQSMIQINAEDIHKGSYWFPNPNATRNLFSPTGYGLKAGEGYYQNIYVLLNFITMGVTDYFSIGFGTEILSLSLGHPMLILNPKFSFELSEEFHVGLSSMLFIANWAEGINLLGIHHAVLTYGNTNNNISVGGGIFTVQDEGSSGVLTISGMLRLSEGTALVSENWLTSSDFSDIPYSTIFSYAIRLMGETYSFDLGFINNSQIASSFLLGVPYVDFIIRW